MDALLPLPSYQPQSRDERLAQAVAAHFVYGSTFPHEAGLARYGHPGSPPTPYGQAWALGEGEHWLAHALGSFYYGLERPLGPNAAPSGPGRSKDFSKAGAAAVLITDQCLHLMLAGGGPTRPNAGYGLSPAKRGDQSTPASRLQQFRVRYLEVQQIGSGDVLFLSIWGFQPMVLRVLLPRTFAAFITGMKATVAQEKALGSGAVTV
jgi:hypothetical protein